MGVNQSQRPDAESSRAVWAIAIASAAMLLAPAIGGRVGQGCFAVGIAALPPAFLALATAGRRDRGTVAAILALWVLLSGGLLVVVFWPQPDPGRDPSVAAAAALSWILGVLCIVPLGLVAGAFARWQRRNPTPSEDP